MKTAGNAIGLYTSTYSPDSLDEASIDFSLHYDRRAIGQIEPVGRKIDKDTYQMDPFTRGSREIHLGKGSVSLHARSHKDLTAH
jgi:hypothetical protein